MVEGVLLLGLLAQQFRFATLADAPEVVPVAHLTVRARDGIRLQISRREGRVSQQ